MFQIGAKNVTNKVIASGVCLAAALCANFAQAGTGGTTTGNSVAHSKISQVAASVPIKINLQRAAIESIGAQQTGSIDLPGMGPVALVGVGAEALVSGNVAWHGYVREAGAGYSADLILSGAGVLGDVRTPAGRYHLEPSATDGQVATFYSASSATGDQCAPPQAAAATKAPAGTTSTIAAPFSAALARSDRAQVDVMFVYTPGVEAKYGANLPAVLDSALLGANSAVSNSGVALNFNLAGTYKVSPRNLVAGDLSAALIAATSSEDSSLPRNDDFSGVAARRRALGADLVVVLVTRADYTVGCAGANGCLVGTAWQATQDSLTSSQPGQHAYAIVDVSASDLTLTVTHEMGHLLGAGHDAVTGGQGLFADSHGYRSPDGQQGDLMSYAPQPSMVFSSPASDCSGGVCATVSPPDNARALSASRFLVAGFQASAPPDVSGLWWDGQPSDQHLFLAKSGGTLTALWFTHNGGQPVWYVATGCQLKANQCSADLYMSWTYQPGILSGAALDPSQVMAAKVGTLELDAGNPANLQAAVTLNSVRTPVSLARQMSGSSGDGMGGIWWASTGLESGIAAMQQGDSLFLTWFTYGSDGRGSWYWVPDCRQNAAATACSGDLYQSSGADQATAQKVGSAGMDFAGAYSANFHWQAGAASGVAPVEREVAAQ